MKVVLAEKPSVARDIAKHLKANQRRDGYLEGDDWAVTWAFGHLVELKEPEEYRPEWKAWKISTLPMIPERFELRARGDDGARKQLETVKRLFEASEEIVCATDAGREGELIFRYILEWAECLGKPIKRLWISSLTGAAIAKGFAELKDGATFQNLYLAARCRSEADWIVGMNATRYFTVEHGKRNLLFSLGRVQTPILAMIVGRDLEIEGFKSEDYWEVHTKCRETRFRHLGGKIEKEEQAKALLEKVVGQPLVVSDVQKKDERANPPLLFDLTELQREMNRRHGFTADQTLRIAQNLYEQKRITYPRTDSRYLSSDLQPTIGPLLRTLQPLKREEIGRLDLEALEFSKRIVDDSKVSDHHAIIPTDDLPGNLNEDESKVYEAIVTRLISVFYPPCIKAVTTVEAQAAGEGFRARGTVLVDPGWQLLYPYLMSGTGAQAAKKNAKSKARKTAEPEEEESMMPDFQVGESNPHDPCIEKFKTNPPRRFTEATLLALMETAGKIVDDEELKEALKEKGVGTPATRASIIEVLIQRKYVERKRKNLISTDSGRHLIALIKDERLKSPELTGEWEFRLKKVERGEYDPETFMSEVVEYTREILSSKSSDTIDLKNLGPCPICRAPVMRGHSGYGCSQWREGCGFVIKDGTLGLTFSPELMRELLFNGRTLEAHALQEKGKKLFGHIALGKKGKLGYELIEMAKGPGDDSEIGACPVCRSAVVEGPKGYGCCNWKNGCKFVIWKEVAKRPVSLEEAKLLLEKGETEVLEGFTSKAGKSFSAKLKVVGARVQFQFVD
ncbi:DNA topoisomerase 3 [Pelagicoccus sp. SDUM812003]|uniref:type IA DNA topoisomerase n=1 Tax=Pelagicoccus sp. SDUM812003 TaxID=3041267 RepID=UPI00280FB844|nr:DNA topoisomerase 3 [Pelagicoccus sp. SDUM812003]MDQ8204522.1 DNA topoisomerase 3 [Pelagicoccus sp. SDUM812003]